MSNQCWPGNEDSAQVISMSQQNQAMLMTAHCMFLFFFPLVQTLCVCVHISMCGLLYHTVQGCFWGGGGHSPLLENLLPPLGEFKVPILKQ